MKYTLLACVIFILAFNLASLAADPDLVYITHLITLVI